MKTLLLSLLIFASIANYENSQACYDCATHPSVIEKQLYEYEGQEIPKKYRVMQQDYYHGCRLYKTLIHIYQGRYKVDVIKL